MDPDDERRALAELEQQLQRENRRLARQLALLHANTAGPGPSWPALAASLTLLLVNAQVFMLAMRWGNVWLLILTVLIFPTVMLPVARSSRRPP